MHAAVGFASTTKASVVEMSTKNATIKGMEQFIDQMESL